MNRHTLALVVLMALAATVGLAVSEPHVPIASFAENFDGVMVPALPAGWVAVNPVGGGALWVTSGTTPDTAPNAAFVDEPNFITDKRLDTPAFVPAGPVPRVRFRHNHNLETGFDGGVLEISINGGAFADIITAGGSFVIGGYTGTISMNFGSPIAGRQAWTGNSSGYKTSVVNLPAAAVGQSVKLRFRMASDSTVSGTGWRVDTTAAMRRTQLVDFDGDGITDWTVLRGVGGGYHWYTLNSAGFSDVTWGSSTVQWVFSGDYDGDGKSDQVVGGETPQVFYIRLSSTGGLLAQPFGVSSDVPLIPGDYDGDLKTDLAVWRPSTGVWWIQRSSDGSVVGQQFGQSGDRNILGDYDGDGIADFTVARGAGGVLTFYIQQSSLGFTAVQWGASGTDAVVPGDYDGDGRTDVAVARNSGGVWTFYARRSSNGALMGQIWGLSTDNLIPGDYDGDGKTDFAVWRPSDGTFYVLKSTNGALLAQPFGQMGDYAISRFMVR